MAREVLDRLEGDDDIDRGVLERDAARVADAEGEVIAPVVGGGMRHDIGGELHADDAGGHLRQQRGAVAFPGGDVEHLPAAAEMPRQQVPVQMLHLGLPAELGRQALAGEGKADGGQGPLEDLSHDQFSSLLPVRSSPPIGRIAQHLAGCRASARERERTLPGHGLARHRAKRRPAMAPPRRIRPSSLGSGPA